MLSVVKDPRMSAMCLQTLSCSGVHSVRVVSKAKKSLRGTAGTGVLPVDVGILAFWLCPLMVLEAYVTKDAQRRAPNEI